MTTRRETPFVYDFEEVDEANPSLLGGKGAHVCEMANLGLPVPPGFVVTTEAFHQLQSSGFDFQPELWEEVQEHVRRLERRMGRGFGDAGSPLVVSVRSGAPVSMPGMMDTILNLGLTDATVSGMTSLMGDERPALDAYRRFIQGFATVVLGVSGEGFERALRDHREQAGVRSDDQLPSESLREIVRAFHELAGGRVPQDPWEQLRQSLLAVFRSWNNPRAITYRDHYRIPSTLGTAALVMTMVFGNLGPDSGTGVLFTRNPATGERETYGEYLPNAQGEDVVAGVRTPLQLAHLRDEAPEVYRELDETVQRLERHYRDAQDVEFTVERGRLYILQTRAAKRTALAAVRMAVEMVEEQTISRSEALRRVDPEDLPAILLPRFDPRALDEASRAGHRLARGIGASPGAATGRIVLDANEAVEAASRREKVLLVRPETSPDDIHGIMQAQGLLTSRGGITSHAAVVTRGMGKPCVVGCESMRINVENGTIQVDGQTLREGEEISIDGATGWVYRGEIPTIDPDVEDMRHLSILLTWADETAKLQVWANADTGADAARARRLGAKGVGLCRTEHMFFAPERLPVMQHVLLNAAETQSLRTRISGLEARMGDAPPLERAALEREMHRAREALEASPIAVQLRADLARLGEMQEADFTEIFREMQGLPVVIRLLDAPLHEFLPSAELLETERRWRRDSGQETMELDRLLELANQTRDIDPMLGHRGCRLGITFPEIYEMQMRAILTAAARLTKEGVSVHPEVMIPLTSDANELRTLRTLLERVRAQVQADEGVDAPVRYGTMIEVPRAALLAGELAEEAEFFSFGSNDLTQMTFAYGRDDAERKFLAPYLEGGILSANPFKTLDTRGVGRLIKLASQEGRETRPELTLGICGEHGGDPESIRFCHALRLDYVSASPLRVPGARLAAAHAALGLSQD